MNEQEEKRKRNIKTIIVCIAVIAILFITIQLIVNSANQASEDYGSERASELFQPNNWKNKTDSIKMELVYFYEKILSNYIL